MFHQLEIVLLLVLSVTEDIFCIMNNPKGNRDPNRRIYFYNPDLFQHAAAALNMFIPPPLYKPVPSIHYSQHPIQIAHYTNVEEEEEEESEEYENNKKPSNLQLFSVFNQKKTKKTKNKKGGGKKKIKKMIKKCLPFKFRIIKKSDVFRNEPHYVNNYDGNLNYNTGENVALISFNTSGILEGKPNFPQVLYFIYPGYNMPQQPLPSPPPRRFIKKFTKSSPKKQFVRYRRPWTVRNKWRLAPPGRPVQEFPLKEPIPSTTGGSPPASPLYNIYKDNRIPLNDNYMQQETQIKYPDNNNIIHSGERYSDPDYYRYGIYDQQQFNSPVEEYNKSNVSEVDTGIKYYYHSTFSANPEKVVTVTPATSWVPIPKIPKNKPTAIKEDRVDHLNKKSIKSGGFKNFNCSRTKTETVKCKTENTLQNQIASNSSDAQYYIEEFSGKSQGNFKTKKKGRSNDQEIDFDDDIVTARYPEDDLSEIDTSIENSNSVRASRSDKGFSAVVSGSVVVQED